MTTEREEIKQKQICTYDPFYRPSVATEKCVRCLKPARIWSGHVLKDGEKIIAGWCSKRCADAKGFVGLWQEDFQ